MRTSRETVKTLKYTSKSNGKKKREPQIKSVILIGKWNKS